MLTGLSAKCRYWSFEHVPYWQTRHYATIQGESPRTPFVDHVAGRWWEGLFSQLSLRSSEVRVLRGCGGPTFGWRVVSP
jgi:hypothetical protein